MGKTYEQKLNDVKNKRNLTMTDCPLALFDEFCYNVKDAYGNIRWVKLQDLMRKAQAYDFLVNSGIVPTQEPMEQIEDEEDNDPTPITFGSHKRND